MAPPPPPPELNADAISEILIRIPPDEPAHLFRASLVCKVWRRILTDPDFLRCYRRFHRNPPLLGFFHDYDIVEPFPRFIPTLAASPFPQAAFDHRPWYAVDCRQGRVLLHKMDLGKFFVWDLVTGDLKDLRKPDMLHISSAAVVCSVACCDHHDCHDGPFLVVCVGEDRDRVAHACVYSSEAGAWGTPVSVHLGIRLYVSSHCGTLIGDEIYFVLGLDVGILMYHLRKHTLSVIEPPDLYHSHIALVPSEDGLLELAGISDSSLYMWSRKTNDEGVVGWVQRSALKLQTLLPIDNPSNVYVIGSAEGAGVIFINTDAGAFIVEVKSGRARKVGEPGPYFSVIPFMSFYTPDCTSVRLPFTEETC